MNHQKIYDSIIQKAKSQNRIRLSKTDVNYVYYEKHHIVPYCLNGKNIKQNTVLLTAREHYICHKLLTFIYPNDRKLALAFHKMTFGIHHLNYKISSKDFEYSRKMISKIGHTEETKEKIRLKAKNRIVSYETKIKISNSSKGLTRSNETRHRISEAKKIRNNNFFKGSVCKSLIEKYGEEIGKNKINEYKQKLRNSNLGKKASEETKRKLSISSHNRKLKTCEYCNKVLDPGNYGKWHGIKCKKYKNDEL